MTEINPRLNRNRILNYKKIILGSFPTWSLSLDKGKKEILLRNSIKTKNGDFDFYFGSSRNLFWKWYSQSVDSEVQIKNTESLKQSLNNNFIGITDIIYSCDRKGKSSFDKDLTNRTYNHKFFNYPQPYEKLKILCTSKGLLNNMLLNSAFFKAHPELTIDNKLSTLLQRKIIRESAGSLKQVRTPVAQVIRVKDAGIIECVALPSPGSPYRRLIDYGFNNPNSHEFIETYTAVVFNWFTESD